MPSFMVKRFRSFVHAFRGIKTLIISEANARIHLAAAAAACGIGVWVRLSALEWCLLSIAICSVLAAEAFNTALEFLADAAIPETRPLVKKSKDTAAGAVLIASIGAIVIGIGVLGPHVLQKITQ